MRADADLMVYVAARWPSLVREAVLLGVHPDEAAEAVTDALARCRRNWHRASSEEDVDAFVHQELVRAAARRPRTPEATRERAVGQLLVLAPPDLDDLKQREREHRRSMVRRAAIVAVPLLLVVAGAGAYVATSGPGGDSLDNTRVTRAENPAPGVFWFADGRLHLDHVVLEVDGLRDMTRIGDGVVYGDDEGRVVYAGDDGSRELLGHKDPDVPVAATDENGWAAWIDPGSGGPSVVVKQAETGNEINRFPVEAGARVVALDGSSVYYVDSRGAHLRSAQASNTIDVSPPALLDVRARTEAFQLHPGTVQVVQPVFNQAFDMAGSGAVLAPDAALVATHLPDEHGRLAVYDTHSGEEMASGLAKDADVLAVAPGKRLTIAYVVAPGGSEDLQLVTCDLDHGHCEVAARIPGDSGTPVLAR